MIPRHIIPHRRIATPSHIARHHHPVARGGAGGNDRETSSRSNLSGASREPRGAWQRRSGLARGGGGRGDARAARGRAHACGRRLRLGRGARAGDLRARGVGLELGLLGLLDRDLVVGLEEVLLSLVRDGLPLDVERHVLDRRLSRRRHHGVVLHGEQRLVERDLVLVDLADDLLAGGRCGV